ncbi:hypothetical protein GCM10011297_11990 [Bacterioplanes sanyensis]|nr:hypothetical protein GCM10011297_11990 [Bacterioplanes sanyensis]
MGAILARREKIVRTEMEMTPTSHTPAHESTATVAPFRAWRGLQLIVARGPMRATTTSDYSEDANNSKTH